MKQMTLFIFALGFAAIIAGCGAKSKAVQEEAKIPVSVASVKLGTVEQALIYNGDIEAEFAVKVFSKIPDRIESFSVDEGDFVEKGQPIAKIVATTIEQGVRQAQAGVTALRAQESNLALEFERSSRLFREGALSKQQFDAIETQFKAIQAQVEQAEAALASASASLGDATITAPLSGIVGKRYLEVGDMVSPGMPLVEIVQMERVKITFDVTETDLGRIKKGQVSFIKVKSFTDKIFQGKVVEISPILDPLTRMARVEVLVDNSDQALKPGMFAQVTVVIGILDNIIAVPRSATIENTSLQRINGRDEVIKKYTVYVVEGEKAMQRELNINYVNHVSIAVNSGIQVGEKLVIKGQNNLRDGVAVAVIEEEI